MAPVGRLNPYRRVEAETMAFSRGVTTEPNAATGVYVSDIHNGDYIKLREVDFGNKSPREFEVSAASALRGGAIEVRLDSIEGEVIALVDVTGTGGWENWKKFSAPVSGSPKGVHDIYFTFKGRKGPKLFTLDWWEFK